MAHSVIVPTEAQKAAAAVKRTHPSRGVWLEDERRQRASYLATRKALAPFLVPHRFEGESKAPTELKRAQYGYGIRLNRTYLDEIFGHVRAAEATYEWGAFGEGEPEPDGTPAGGIAREMWTDATRAGRAGETLRNFFERTVLEWLGSAPGGLIITDAPVGSNPVTEQERRDRGIRPYWRFIPWSAVEDLGWSNTGLRFVKFIEVVDQRDPEGEGDNKMTTLHVLYRIEDGTGDTLVTRRDDEGKYVDREGNPAGPEPIRIAAIRNPDNAPRLPITLATLGEHPELAFLGTGLLYGLEDIVIDLFNVLSEMREAFRDAAFSLLKYKGGQGPAVKDQLSNGSRLIDVGDGEHDNLERLAGDAAEVTAGLALIDMGVRNWALGAKRQAAEAMGNMGAEQASGVSLAAEFQLDLKPLLVVVAEALDAIETDALFVAAQMAGLTVEQADEVAVTRSTDFQLEDEASRIARIVREFTMSLPLPAEAKVAIFMRWLEVSELIDLSDTTVRATIERQIRELAEAEQTGEVNRNTMPPAPLFGGDQLPARRKDLSNGEGGKPGEGDRKAA